MIIDIQWRQLLKVLYSSKSPLVPYMPLSLQYDAIQTDTLRLMHLLSALPSHMSSKTVSDNAFRYIGDN